MGRPKINVSHLAPEIGLTSLGVYRADRIWCNRRSATSNCPAKETASNTCSEEGEEIDYNRVTTIGWCFDRGGHAVVYEAASLANKTSASENVMFLSYMVYQKPESAFRGR